MHRYSILKIELGKGVNVGKGDSVFVLILLNIFFGARMGYILYNHLGVLQLRAKKILDFFIS